MNTQENAAEILDGRTEGEKILDKIMGHDKPSALDKSLGLIVKTATDLFLNPTRTQKHLLLGEECTYFVRTAESLGVKRAEAVFKITERLGEAGLVSGDRSKQSVNDWMRVYHLALLCTGADVVKKSKDDDESIKAVPQEWMSTHAYRTLACLTVAVEPDGESFKPGWADFVTKMLREGFKGKRLEAAVKAHTEYVKDMLRTNKISQMTPDQVSKFEQKELTRQQDAAERSMKRFADQMAEKAQEAGLAPADLLIELVSRGHIPAPEPVLVPLGGDDMAKRAKEIAKALDTDSATQLAASLVERGDEKIVRAMVSILQGWLRTNNVQPAPANVPAMAVVA